MQRLGSLYIAPSPIGGRGVFTTEPISAGALIEICPVIVLPPEDRAHIHATRLHDYYFIWGEHDRKTAVVLGYGSLFNHSFEPSAEYRPDFQGETLDFYALRQIEAGEEITVNYGGDPRTSRAVWFKMKKPA